jgi:hypothetical protein
MMNSNRDEDLTKNDGVGCAWGGETKAPDVEGLLVVLVDQVLGSVAVLDHGPDGDIKFVRGR